MTVREPQTVFDVLDEAPTMRVYRYEHTQSHDTLYALFPHGQHDDMATSPYATNAVLLYDEGYWTEDGSAWLQAQKVCP